jgi:HEAT repeat protein
MADYRDPDVRESLADAITYSINDHSRPEAEAIAVLVRLAADAEPDVRYSAVFELAYWAPDLPVVRDCLLVATEDADTQIAAYARGGLGRLDGKSLEECPDRELVDY